MGKLILVTGGAGFIGSHLSDELLQAGHRVRCLDNLSPQVHGSHRTRPDYLARDIELIVGDVRDRDVVRRAVRGVDGVFHLAAAVGVGQSMYEVERYTDVNNRGTAVLLEALIERPVERLVVASSMSVYGEGLYRASNGKAQACAARSAAQLKAGLWEMHDERGKTLRPVPTPETKQPSLASVYALSKYDQEQMALIVGRAYGIPTVALRLFNVFGPRQALSNPYTGVLAIFASRLMNDRPPLVYEDGLQQRDFVSVYDVVQAFCLALEVPEAAGNVFNVGSGERRTVREVADRLAALLGKSEIKPAITGKYRAGDIRHCFADMSRVREVLGYRPRIAFDKGLLELTQWLAGRVALDHFERASAELASRGLTV